MAKRKKLKNTRPKALFGADGAIMAAATLTAAGIQSAATYAGAKQQADAAIQGAKTQADMLQKQNENDARLQTELMQFTKAQNDESRQIMKDTQMNLQLLTGAQNMRDRREQSKTIVKYGGSKRRQLRNAYSSLQGGNSFQVVDGGGALPFGQDYDGLPIGMFVGKKHYQKHKTKKGTIEGGVGAKLNGGGEFEAEGGEAYKETPNGVNILSAHTRHGFNPTYAFMNGMPFDEAYSIQEYYKAVDGIDSEGNKTTPVKRKKASIGGTILPYYDNYNVYDAPTIIPGATAVALEQANARNTRNTLKQGGSVKKQIASLRNRHKFDSGGNWWLSPTISGAGNLLGAGLSTLGTIFGANRLNKAIGKAGQIMHDAYSKLRGVDINDVFGDSLNASFNLGHYMPALRSSYYNADPWLEEVHRNMRRTVNTARNNTNSSAAQYNRLATADVNSSGESSKVYATKHNWEEEMKQKNMEAINQAAAQNAQLDLERIKNVAAVKADLAKFNANVANERELGMGQSDADALQAQGEVNANKWNTLGQTWGSTIANIGAGFGSAWDAERNYQEQYKQALLKADDSAVSRMFTLGYGTESQAKAHMDKLAGSINNNPNSAYAKEARAQYDAIAKKYGLPSWEQTYGIRGNRGNSIPVRRSITNGFNLPTLSFD